MLICCRHRCGEFHFSQKEIGNGKEIQFLSQGQKRCSFDSHIFMIFWACFEWLIDKGGWYCNWYSLDFSFNLAFWRKRGYSKPVEWSLAEGHNGFVTLCLLKVITWLVTKLARSWQLRGLYSMSQHWLSLSGTDSFRLVCCVKHVVIQNSHSLVRYSHLWMVRTGM